MNVFFDKANFLSFIASSKKDKTVYEECNKMLKRECCVKFNFNRNDFLEEERLVFDYWIRTATEGVGDNDAITWGVQFPPRPISNNTFETLNANQCSSVYLLDGDDFNKYLKGRGCLMCASLGEELDCLRSLLINDRDYGRLLSIKELKGWKDMEKYFSPCTDIVIYDKYILNSPDLYEYNIFPLLESLCKNARNTDVNIVIITLRRCNGIEPPREEVREKIRAKIRKKVGKTPNLTIVCADKVPDHDRFIFTNYKFIISGDTFNYFKSNNELETKGRSFSIVSFVDKAYWKQGMVFIDDMQKFINERETYVIGDKKSRYLKLVK